jgi:hypothetical protein
MMELVKAWDVDMAVLYGSERSVMATWNDLRWFSSKSQASTVGSTFTGALVERRIGRKLSIFIVSIVWQER